MARLNGLPRVWFSALCPYLLLLSALVVIVVIAGEFGEITCPGKGWIRREIGEGGVAVEEKIDPFIYFDSELPGNEEFRRENFSLEWTGYLHVAIPTTYMFALVSDDGSELWIDDILVVDNSGEHAVARVEGSRWLEKRDYKITIRYQNRLGLAVMRAEFRLGDQWILLSEDRIRSSLPNGAFLGFLSDALCALKKIFKMLLPFMVSVPILVIFKLAVGSMGGNRQLINLAFFFACLLMFFSTPNVNCDGYGYYAYLRSIIFDGDLEFKNEYLHVEPEFYCPPYPLLELKTPTGHTSNCYSIGPAILWSPFYLFSLASSYAVHHFDSRYQFDGYSIFEVAGTGFGTSFWAFIGILLSYFMAKELVGKKHAIIASIIAWTGTTLFYHSFIETSFAHAISSFAVSLYVFLWLKFRRSKNVMHWLLLGGAGGLMALTYWQNALLLIMGLGDLALVGVRQENSKKNSAIINKIYQLAYFLAGFIVVISPQMASWKIIFGRFLEFPERVGGVWGPPKFLLNVFFSPYHGLFTWTPLTIFCLYGFFVLLRKKIGSAWYSMIAAFFLFTIHNSMLIDWCGGGGFGMRRFTNMFIFLMLGLSVFIQKYWQSALCKVVLIISACWAFFMIPVHWTADVNVPMSMPDILRIMSSLSVAKCYDLFFPSTFIKYFWIFHSAQASSAFYLFIGYYFSAFLFMGIALRKIYTFMSET